MSMEKVPSTFTLSVKLHTDGDWFIDYENFKKVNIYNFKLKDDGDFKFEIIDYCLSDLDKFINEFILIVNSIFKLKYHKTIHKKEQSIFEYFNLTKENFIGTKFTNGNYSVVFKLKEKTEYIN